MTPDALQQQPAWLDALHPREGRYVLGPLLGAGGMGDVREAWDVVLRRTVALKILKKIDPLSLTRFIHEAQLQGRLVHPNICRIYDVESADGAPRIAMQLVRGPTLADAAEDLTLKEIVTILAQVAEAVHAAHRIKLVHRDLKPSNILLEKDAEQRWVPYVCDFGLAMDQEESSLTQSLGIKGTPAYMAPEQLRGDRGQIGPATDIYALGGTLYFAIYGEPPRTFPLAEEMLLGRRMKPLVLPRPAHRELPRDLETILQKCLELKPSLRFHSAAALAEDLWRHLNGQKIHARPVGLLDLLGRWLRPRRRLSLAAGLGSCLILAGLLGQRAYRTSASDQQAEWTRLFALQATELEQDLRVEKMLPIHDLRPSFARIRARMADFSDRLGSLDTQAQGPGHVALARCRFLLKDFAGAQAELEQAWNLGVRSGEVASLLARIQVASPELESAIARPWEALGAPGKGLPAEGGSLREATVAYLQRDYYKALGLATAEHAKNPYHFEPVYLRAMSLLAWADQAMDSGDFQGAEEKYREAMADGASYLFQAQSDDRIHHLLLRASRRLAALLLNRGSLTAAVLDNLRTRCEQALKLDPADPDLQHDWLQTAFLRAMLLTNQGRDPAPALESAQVFLGLQGNAPLAPAVQADQALLQWRLAERSFSRGEAAAATLSAPLTLPPEQRVDILNFTARVQATRGEDPSATLDAALETLRPLQDALSWRLCEVAAETWLLRAQWQASLGGDAAAALDRAKALVDLALQTNPGSATAQALSGLAQVQEAALAPGKRALLFLQARERLRLAEAIQPGGRHLDLLKRALKA